MQVLNARCCFGLRLHFLPEEPCKNTRVAMEWMTDATSKMPGMLTHFLQVEKKAMEIDKPAAPAPSAPSAPATAASANAVDEALDLLEKASQGTEPPVASESEQQASQGTEPPVASGQQTSPVKVPEAAAAETAEPAPAVPNAPQPALDASQPEPNEREQLQPTPAAARAAAQPISFKRLNL